MLDFAIFAVTFLLALVGAVLYLYPVTAIPALTGSGRRPHPRRAARSGPQGTGPGGGLQLPPPLCPAPGARDASQARAAGAEDSRAGGSTTLGRRETHGRRLGGAGAAAGA